MPSSSSSTMKPRGILKYKIPMLERNKKITFIAWMCETYSDSKENT